MTNTKLPNLLELLASIKFKPYQFSISCNIAEKAIFSMVAVFMAGYA